MFSVQRWPNQVNSTEDPCPTFHLLGPIINIVPLFVPEFPLNKAAQTLVPTPPQFQLVFCGRDNWCSFILIYQRNYLFLKGRTILGTTNGCSFPHIFKSEPNERSLGITSERYNQWSLNLTGMTVIKVSEFLGSVSGMKQQLLFYFKGSKILNLKQYNYFVSSYVCFVWPHKKDTILSLSGHLLPDHQGTEKCSTLKYMEHINGTGSASKYDAT